MTPTNKKRLVSALGAIALTTICAVFFYLQTYPIKLNMATLDWQVIREIERDPAPEVEFLGKGLGIDRKEFYLISLDGKFGCVSFERGPFGRHRLGVVSYGDGSFANGIIESNGKKYLLFSGLDSQGAIDKIEVEIQGVTYELTPGQHRPFLTYCEVDPNTNAQKVNLFDIVFYDEMGNDITSNYELSAGLIQ